MSDIRRRKGLGISPNATTKNGTIPRRLKIAGIALRSLFVILLLFLAAHLSAPQNETLWSAYETTGDLIRLLLGLALCIWIAVHLLMPPKDAQAYRTWVYLGLTLLPLMLIWTIAIW
jgi:hypothetical protein